MKQVFLITVLILTAGLGYLAYDGKLQKAAREEEEAKALAVERQRSEVEYRKQQDEREKAYTAKREEEKARETEERAREAAERARDMMSKVMISRNLEPIVTQIFADLNTARAQDLVPMLEVTRERILDKKTLLTDGRQQIYEAAEKAVLAMMPAADERTDALQALLTEATRKTRLDSANTANNSGAFFARSIIKRWDDGKAQRKLAADQAMNQLREKERLWNAQTTARANIESYDVPSQPNAQITADSAALASGGSALDRGAYNKRERPWRRVYYDSNGYRYYYYYYSR